MAALLKEYPALCARHTQVLEQLATASFNIDQVFPQLYSITADPERTRLVEPPVSDGCLKVLEDNHRIFQNYSRERTQESL